MKLGEKLQKIRHEKKMSQEELSEASGVSIRTIQRIEKDDVTPRPYTVRAILEAMKVSIEDFNNKIDSSQESYPNENIALNKFILANITFLFLPIVFIFLIISLRKKQSWSANYDWFCKKILSFQVLWTIFTLIVILSSPFIIKLYDGQMAIGKMPTPLLIYLILSLLNFSFIIFSGYKIKFSKAEFLSFIPNLF